MTLYATVAVANAARRSAARALLAGSTLTGHNTALASTSTSTSTSTSYPLSVPSSSYSWPSSSSSLSLSAVAAMLSSRRHLSDGGGSHSDFAPKLKPAPNVADNNKDDDEEQATLDMIRTHVETNRVMLYMKGSPSMPMCGFSARVVQVLKEEGVDFSSVNVLDYPSIREGVKKFSDWPTIPQLYIDGEFVGGCDIVTSMHESGELGKLLSSSSGADDDAKEEKKE